MIRCQIEETGSRTEGREEAKWPAWHTVWHAGGESLVTQSRASATWPPGEGRGEESEPPRAPSIVQSEGSGGRERHRAFIHAAAGGRREERRGVQLSSSLSRGSGRRTPNLRRANVAPPGERRVHGGGGDGGGAGAAFLEHPGCFFASVERRVSFPACHRGAVQVRLGPILPKWPRCRGVRFRGGAGSPAEDALAVCCYSVTSFSPVQAPR